LFTGAHGNVPFRNPGDQVGFISGSVEGSRKLSPAGKKKIAGILGKSLPRKIPIGEEKKTTIDSHIKRGKG